MKKRIFLAIVLLFGFIGFVSAQTSDVDNLFDKYSGKDGFTTIDVAQGLFELLAGIDAEDEEFEDFQKAISGIEKLRLIAFEGENHNEKEKFYKDIMTNVPFKQYNELMVVKESDADIRFYGKSEGSVISELLMVVDGKDEAVLMCLTGNIDLNHVAKLARTMDIHGLEHLNNFDKEKDK